jgi:hypothetical protein
MSFTAVVIKGTIILPPEVNLPDGTEVKIEPVTKPERTFGEEFREFIGCIKEGPADLADNHDHYLYGTPKRVP